MTGTPSLSVVKELFRYNYWARDRQLEACGSLTDEQFLCSLSSSFPSIRDTLVHLIAAEQFWLACWHGQSPGSTLSPEEVPTLAAVSQRWRKVEFETREYLAALSNEALPRPVTYVDPSGRTWTHTLWRMMLHLLLHQSYHRGQVTTLLRQVGVEPPEVDFLTAHDMAFGA
jgi:uncharacterized damage-inducible protein DinB